ncbi:MAG: hypothetical protein QOG73_3367 [Acetobacteraceae bacterium]|jgi:hypothetical protein|nr:hypothetical protein [Acetobacteraceae bacterium]
MMDDETADRLRALLGDLQAAVYNESGVPEEVQEKLVTLISARGFRLVDELQGAVR